MLVQISSKWLLYMLQMLLVGHHCLKISSGPGFAGLQTTDADPKLIFPIFLSGQNNVYSELAWCDFGDYIIITYMTEISI